MVIQELGQGRVTVARREPADVERHHNRVTSFRHHYSLPLVALALGELPLVDERHVVGVCAELGGHDAVSRHAVAPRARQRLGVRLGAEAAPQPRQDLHQGLVGLALDLGRAV